MMRLLRSLIASAMLTVVVTAGSPTATESAAPNGPQWTQVEILNITSAGGTVSDTLAPVSKPEQIDAFVSGLASPDAARLVRRAARAAEVPAGHRLMGAVVAQGCEPPTEVDVHTGSGSPTVDVEVGQRNLQCFAAITSVALVSVRADLIPGS